MAGEMLGHDFLDLPDDAAERQRQAEIVDAAAAMQQRHDLASRAKKLVELSDDTYLQPKSEGTLYAGLGLIDPARTRRSQHRSLNRGGRW